MQIIDDRRALHRIPELDRNLPETMGYLRESLSGLRCEVFSPMEGALCAFFDFGKPDAIAFRADADALPIREESRSDYVSVHPGKMHACGHDGHMAIVLELARRVSAAADMPHNILLVFQPAEETTGGARALCATGVFAERQAAAIFGLHIWPGLEKGLIFSRCNEMMSRSCEVKVDIRGVPSHITRPSEGIDALAAGAEFYRRARAMEAVLPKNIFRLLNFGVFRSGDACNVLSGHTRLEGTLRAFQDEVFYSLRSGLVSIGKDVERAFGCTVNVDMNDGYPAVMNPPDLYRRVRRAVGFFELDEPVMTTEDFSWYQRTLPGMFFFLGAGNAPALHTDCFDFDESILVKGADFFYELAKSF